MGVLKKVGIDAQTGGFCGVEFYATPRGGGAL